MKTIQIYDTTLRDGAQGEGVSFSLEDKVLIARKLDKLGFDFIEGGYPLSNPKDAEFFQRLHEKPLENNAKLCAFGMTRRKGVVAKDDPGMIALIKAETPVVTIVGKTSDFHAKEVLGVSLEENLAMIRDTVEFFVSEGKEVIYDAEHFFDGWKANADYAPQTIKAAAEAGASIIVMCDTNGGSLPEEIAQITKEASSAVDIPLGIHTHNDSELAVANSLSAIDAGATHVQGTINGLGERCGNADLISVVANLALKKQGYQVLGGDGSNSGGGAERLTELSRYVYEIANMLPRNGQPFVGQSAFAHKGGMHVHAVAKAAHSYEHIDPTEVGNERRILVSELSGRSNILALATKLELDKDKDLMGRVLKEVVELENQGYQFEAAEASFEILLKKLAGTFQPHFELIKYHIDVDRLPDGTPITEATVKLQVGEEVRHEVAEGDGPVNALDGALRKALAGHFPELAKMHLVDYKVRVINSEAATAASVRVVIESRDEIESWGTVGVHENVIEASWMALVDSLEYKLCRSES
ncbi:citramalate synthase [Adhaeretor mobilis]|uniref:Citramalate synthase n=1 Tax=Adhaeretor mobilis TaxID=1930276 RepID=A0A517MSF8_9BACT|nr:citramalate synthase [Adhaeretor mobilis]QDS97811.1 2-isopropylmalate synthase [Adhaeretor mobilis]